jgi:hypothetical protein
MIAGYERPSQVRAMLKGFQHERKGTSDPRWLAAIDEQERIFQEELARMEAEGVPEEAETTNPAMGTGAWVGKTGRGRIIV